MSDPHPRIDPASFPLLGLLGAVACGPVAPQDTDGGTDSTEGTGPTTNPSDPTSPTSPTTTEPMPECRGYSDCDHLYCGYCTDNGVCRESVGCCGGYGASVVAGKWRCSPGYDCYDDRECGDDYACVNGQCVSNPPIRLPDCGLPQPDLEQWNLSNAPGAFVLADLDGDGDLDLAAAQPGAGAIEIALNDGAGSFTLTGTVSVAAEPTGAMDLAAGDLDGDGDLDLVLTRREPAGVLHLVFNDGAVFTVTQNVPVGSEPRQVLVADVHGDALPDLLILRDSFSPIEVHVGLGMGQFAPGLVEFGAGGRASAADLDLDGRADLLAPVPSGLALLRGDPVEHLTLQQIFAADNDSAAGLSGDLDFNGLPDLVLIHPDGVGGMARVWAGVAPQTWTTSPQRFAVTTPLTGGLLVELDALPGPDLVSAPSSGLPRLIILPGDGKGGFACEATMKLLGDTAPALLAVGDLDGDGRPEILAGDPASPAATVLRLQP